MRFYNAPHMVEPLDMTIRTDCHRITLMWAAQTAKTTTQLCAQGYFIDQRPRSQMMMQPSQGDLKTWLETKFNPMVAANPALQNKLAKPRGRDGVNNQEMKSYPGGFLMFAWSGSPKTMRGRSAPVIFADEVDGYERTAEGDPVSLLEQRSATFGDDRLLFETSTPTIANASQIEKSYAAGDRRRRYLPCPHCETYQTLKWSNVQWDKDGETGEHLPDTACYVCDGCGVPLSDGERLQMLQQGEWRAERPFRGHASYHLNELYSTFRSLSDIVLSFLDKKAKGDMQTFVNVSLAETWEEGEKRFEHTELFNRRREFPAEVPQEYCVLTASVDVQDDRVEIEVEAWGDGERNAKIDLIIIHGDLSQRSFWENDVDAAISATYMHESGVKLPISCVAVDSGGHFTEQVYRFVKPRERRRVYAIKGRNGAGYPVVSRPSKTNKGKVLLFSIGTDTAKELIYKRYEIEKRGSSGYIDFPILPCFDEEFFQQLVAEQVVTFYRKGFPHREWRKRRARNEALDLSVYNLAALYILNPNFKALMSKLEEQMAPPVSAPAQSPIQQQVTTHQTKVRKPRKRRGGYVSKWKP